MNRRRADRIHFKGNLVFPEQPDWDSVAKGVSIYCRINDLDCHNLMFDRAEVSEDGRYRVPFKSFGHVSAYRYHDRNRESRTQEEMQELFFQDLVEDMAGFFCCEVEIEPLTLDLAHLDHLEEAVGIYESGPGRFMGVPRPIEGDDLRPEGVHEDDSDPLAELNDLVGLASVKRQVNDIVKLVRTNGRNQLPCLHMVFTGNPGTGKTTVARLLGRIFDREGVTSGKGTFVETDRGGLCGMFVGHTASKTQRVIERAEGGVLFVDEAYSLGMYESGRDYGEEALATLVKAMEDKRDSMVCILAGYSKPMSKMIDVNPGLRDRIGFYIDFPDYDAGELADIFRQLARNDSMRLSAKADEMLSLAMERLYANRDENFSNGRIVRKVYERVRLSHMINSSSSVLCAADFERALADGDLGLLVQDAPGVATGFC